MTSAFAFIQTFTARTLACRALCASMAKQSAGSIGSLLAPLTKRSTRKIGSRSLHVWRGNTGLALRTALQAAQTRQGWTMVTSPTAPQVCVEVSSQAAQTPLFGTPVRRGLCLKQRCHVHDALIRP